MNREDIIRIAQDAGLHIATDVSWMPIIGLKYAEKFAALVIANHPPQSYMTWQEGYEAGKQTEREVCAKLIAKLTEMLEMQQKLHETAIDMLKPAIEAEREACAKVCEDYGRAEEMQAIGNDYAETIRARGEK